MKSKKYRLETVLEIRGRAKDEAARAVAARLEQLARAEAELNRRTAELGNCRERRRAAQNAMFTELSGGTQARSVTAHKDFLSHLKETEIELEAAVEQQKQAVAAAEREVERARERLIEAAKDLKAIELHKSSWKIAERTSAARREQKISDEIGAILHGRRGDS
ncbi:MAG: flagellar export protein FliJ [Acidobacteriota bacterium]|nr:flagellar export protein FliJ [Acidobacteriota bacterium]